MDRHTVTSSLPGTETLVLRYLACPACHSEFESDGAAILCPKCGFRGAVIDGVAVMAEREGASYFDDKHAVMSEGKLDPATWSMFYEEQVKCFEESLRPGMVVLDVGCGPRTPYSRNCDFLLIGVDPSFESIRANASLDIPVYASSQALPLPRSSIDLIACFYSIHHMTGETLLENLLRVSNAFREFSRVIRPGGSIMIFDVSPWWPGAVVGNALWNTARRLLGTRLDMYFWRDRSVDLLGKHFFRKATPRIETFSRPLFSTFPPIFSIPRLKIPRVLYPFDINLYRWDFPVSVRS